MGSMTLLNDLAKINLEAPEMMLGKGSMMPFNASNSGARKLMFGTQVEHRLQLLHPEVPFIQTGYEKEFGKYSSSFFVADKDYKILAKIPKFTGDMSHYYAICLCEEDSQLHMFERVDYKHITENYGYMWNNDALDHAEDILPKGTVIRKSTSFDEYDLRMDGVNLLTMYSACEETMQDPIKVSESAAKKLASPLVKRVKIDINDNDIPLNLYGTDGMYKSFPDIGEEIRNATLCAIRREKKEESLYTLAYDRLKEIFLSDIPYTVVGRVVDIDIKCNNPEKIHESEYYGQLARYYDDHIRMCKEVCDTVEQYSDALGYKMSYELQRLYWDCRNELDGMQFLGDRLFSNITMYITVIEELGLNPGDKLSNRFGGKGVVSVVVPDELMPRTRDGRVIDVIMNMCGVYGRENPGQLFEISYSHVAIQILSFIQSEVLEISDAMKLYLDYLELVAPQMYAETVEFVEGLTDDEAVQYLGAMTSDESIYICAQPMSENPDIKLIAMLYERFPWAKPAPIWMPIKGANGNVRYTLSRRPIVYGYQYIYRLKQYAEEKFSVTNLSSTNIRNENSKNKASNNYKALYSRTPIRFGDMEIGNMIHLGPWLIVQMLMLYSTSPMGRRNCEELLTGDPFNIDVKLDMDSPNRNVEILNTYLKAIGLRLTFKRIPKVKPQLMEFSPMEFYPDTLENFALINPMQFWPEDVKLDPSAYRDALLATKGQKRLVSPMEFFAMTFDK